MRVQLLAHGRGQVCVDRISNKVMSKREPIIHLDQETGVLSLVEQGQQITRSPITAARSATEKTDPSTDANRRRLSASDERKRSRLRKSNSAAGTE
jgi:hypothetical protein